MLGFLTILGLRFSYTIFYSRAQWERPGYNNVEEGLHKTRSAIENTLSSHLDFLELEDIIRKIINDPSLDLGYTYEPSTDPSKFELDEEDREKLGDWKPETFTIREEDERTSESSDSEDKSKAKQNAPLLLFPQPTDFDRGRRRSSILEVHLIGQVSH